MRFMFCLALASVVTSAPEKGSCKWGILTCSMSILGLTNVLGCPDGEYQGDISLACQKSYLWGHGQCYKGFEINCRRSFFGEFLNMWHTRGSKSTFGDGIGFCKDYAPDTTALEFAISKTADESYFTIGCFENINHSTRRPWFPHLRSVDWYGATYCPSFPSTPHCCTPFTGNVSNICVDSGSPDYGQGECLPGGWKIGCEQSWTYTVPPPFELYFNLTLATCWGKCAGNLSSFSRWNGAEFYSVPDQASPCSCYSTATYLGSNNPAGQKSGIVTKLDTPVCDLPSSPPPVSSSYLPTTSSTCSPSSSTSWVTKLKFNYNKLINQLYINNFGNPI